MLQDYITLYYIILHYITFPPHRWPCEVVCQLITVSVPLSGLYNSFYFSVKFEVLQQLHNNDDM
jgi:hypothetical protein